MNFLIDPTDVINYRRTPGELELWYLFGLVVAGKTATTQSRLLSNFLNSLPATNPDTPFSRIRATPDNILLERLKESRLGQYNRLYRAIKEGLSLDLRTCSIADLEAIHGVGPKTARMFVMMSREGARHAALDTHILKFLSTKGHEVPKSTPSAGPTYRRWEEQFLIYADESGKTVAEFDLDIWKSYAIT